MHFGSLLEAWVLAGSLMLIWCITTILNTYLFDENRHCQITVNNVLQSMELQAPTVSLHGNCGLAILQMRGE